MKIAIINGPYWRMGLLAVLCVFAAVGCGNPEEDASVIPPPKASVPDGSKLDASALNLELLESSSNRIVANNAKRLRKAFEKNNYTDAAFALSTIASLRLDGSAESVVENALRALHNAATIAAAAGDGNAQFALNHLKEVFGI